MAASPDATSNRFGAGDRGFPANQLSQLSQFANKERYSGLLLEIEMMSIQLKFSIFCEASTISYRIRRLRSKNATAACICCSAAKMICTS